MGPRIPDRAERGGFAGVVGVAGEPQEKQVGLVVDAAKVRVEAVEEGGEPGKGHFRDEKHAPLHLIACSSFPSSIINKHDKNSQTLTFS